MNQIIKENSHSEEDIKQFESELLQIKCESSAMQEGKRLIKYKNKWHQLVENEGTFIVDENDNCVAEIKKGIITNV